MAKGTLMLASAGCCIVGGNMMLAPAFLSAPSASTATAPLALRGATSAAAPGVSEAAWVATAGAAAALTAAAAATPQRQRRGGVRATATVAKAAAAASAAVEEDTPPPEEVFDPRKEPGVTLPLMYFDPLGFAKKGDREGFRNLRAAELKHGRVAMMAALGCVVQHSIKFPGFNEVPAGLKAVTTAPGTYGLAVLFLAAGAIELTVGAQDPEKDPGDFGDPAGFGQYFEEWKNRELNNGRMGMVAITAILGTELVTGLDGVEQILRPISNLSVE